jgi:polyisoprenoid-binding protein YceI
MKTFTTVAFICLAATTTFAQRYMVQKSRVSFFSDAVLEDITAHNTRVAGLLDLATSEFAFSVPIREFQFRKSLMKEHFNEKYMESEKYPKGTFTGTLSGFSENKDGQQQVTAKGKLTIHGVSREVEIPGTIEKGNSKFSITAKFMVRLKDYDIAIPQLLWQNIAEEVEVSVDLTLVPQ